MGVGVPRQAVSGVVPRVVGVRAESPQPAAVLAEGPQTQVAAAQKQEGSGYERNTVAKSFPIVVAA